MRQVRAAVGLRQRQQQVALRQVADQEHVEEAVVRLRVRADHHPAAERRPFATTTSCMRPPRISSSTDDAELRVLPAREDGERRPEVRDLAAERLRRLVRALRDRAAHAGARDVREPGLGLAPVPGAVARRGRGRSCAASP